MHDAPPSPHPTRTPRLLNQTGLLIAGDLTAFIVFVWMGRSSHALATGLEALSATVSTAAPFMLGWLLVAPWLGAFDAPRLTTVRAMAGRTALAWLVAWPVSLAVRALALQRGVPLSFALVTGAVILLLLVGWRSVFALLRR